MLQPFFAAAMLAPGRQLSFRRLAVAHVLLLTALGFAATRVKDPKSLEMVGHLTLIVGIVEGAALIGWRLTQLPKSQALEFLLTSPLQPKRLFVAEMLVGVSRFLLVWLAGLPVLAGMVFAGVADLGQFAMLAVLPAVCGVFSGLALTAWVYEPVAVRRAGEGLALLGVLVYLVIGVLAGERLLYWLQSLPSWAGRPLFDGILWVNDHNPFGLVRYWFARDRVPAVAWERFELAAGLAAVLAVLAGVRAAFRLRGHFHDRHYRPIDSRRRSQLDLIGDRPLSWWAVRRVMEYSGRVNLWLAGGFSLLYAAFIVAGDAWPAWMGKGAFVLFELWGGAAGVACALCVLAAVPAVFQFGLWDATVQDRCRRLELLLLTDLTPRDYWHASVSAAWKRGRGYFVAAGVLWAALALGGRNSWAEVIAVAAGAAILWAFSFAVGFRSFASGAQTSGLASLLTLGTPLALFGLLKAGLTTAAAFVPTAVCYLPLRPGVGVTPAWAVSCVLLGATTVLLTRRGLARCDADLRAWYDANQGKQTAG